MSNGFLYAQLNENAICIGVSMLANRVTDAHMIEIDNLAEDFMWRKYKNGEWSEEKFLPAEAIDPQETNGTTLEDKINYIYYKQMGVI